MMGPRKSSNAISILMVPARCRVCLAVVASTFVATASAFQITGPGSRLKHAARLRGSVPLSGASMQLMDPVVTNMIIGAASGSMSNMAVFPFELAKTRMQNAKKGEKKEYRNLVTSIATITKDGGGISALWAGSVPVLIGGAPESALQLAAHS